MRVGDTVKTRDGFHAKITALCDHGCVRLLFGGGIHATYPEEQLKRLVTDEEKDRVYRAAMDVHRLQGSTCLVYQLTDARDELRDACKGAL